MTSGDYPVYEKQVRPPAGMIGKPGPLLQIVRDQRVAFLIVGGMNTAVGTVWFILFLSLVGDTVGYLGVLLCAHVAAVLCAFVLYRRFVFRVTGHVLRDLARFEMVNLSVLGFNFAMLPLLVELFDWPVLLSQLVVTAAVVLISWFGHRGFSFHRTPSEIGIADQKRAVL